ncbi:hypothetical protein DENSPDRAFT_837818 [Dentipellis sp. KUC8613]|nr:hypothetical protein DENSPDRAFT_837818 [Dentipellis sp. KUC8613]
MDHSQQGNETAKWTPEDEQAFIDFLTEHVSERGEENYKMTTFTAAAAFLEGRRTAGGPKIGMTCKNKWARLKETHGVCYRLKNCQSTSGFTWDEDRGAEVRPEGEVAWRTFVEKYPRAAHFRHRGWPLYKAVDNIIPDIVKANLLASRTHTAKPSDELPASSMTAEDAPRASPDVSEVEALLEENARPSASNANANGDSGRAPYVPPPLPPAPPSRRKRTALEMDAPTTYSRASSFEEESPYDIALAHSIERMTDALIKFLASEPDLKTPAEPSEPSAKRRRTAIELAARRENKVLSVDDLVDFIEIMRRDVTVADTYLAVARMDEKLCRSWIQRVLADDRS